MKNKITFTLNGEQHSVEVRANQTLLDLLRDQMGIKSPKKGCDRGDCGSCTVMLNGRSVRSCLILAPEVDGCSVTTLEGLMKDGIHIVQQVFHEKNAFQCGFCAPGIIISVVELLNRNPNPSRHDVQEAIAGNLCRCTGYESIIDGVLEAAERMRGVQ